MAGYVALGVPLEYLLAASHGGTGWAADGQDHGTRNRTAHRASKGRAAASEKYINSTDAATGAMNGLQMMGGMVHATGLHCTDRNGNGMLEAGGAWLGIEQLTLERVLVGILQPLAWALGIPWDEAQLAGSRSAKNSYSMNLSLTLTTAKQLRSSAHSQAIVISPLRLRELVVDRHFAGRSGRGRTESS